MQTHLDRAAAFSGTYSDKAQRKCTAYVYKFNTQCFGCIQLERIRCKCATPIVMKQPITWIGQF